MPDSAIPSRAGRAWWALIAFMAAFATVLIMVSNRFLLPAMEAAVDADRTARKHLAAISALVLVVVLFCLFALLFIILRPGRLFLPRKTEPRLKTTYVDAWEESARRIKVDDDEPAA